MPKKGDLRWREIITVDGDKVVSRTKILQQYQRWEWGVYGWMDVPTEQVIY